MKKMLYCAAALASMLFAASCQQENLELNGNGAVTFTVTTPDGIDTRTIADGENVNKVHWAVYKTNSNEEFAVAGNDGPLAQGAVDMTAKRATVEMDLLQDQYYTVIFWAQVEEADHYEIGDLRNITARETTVDGNDESRAAFYAVKEFDTKTQQNYEVTLYRPFAQLNLGTTNESLSPDYSGVTQSYTIDVTASKVSVYGLSSTFNTIAGAAVEGNETHTFKSATIPADFDPAEVLTVNGTDYHYVAMNYLFVPENDKLVKVSYEIATDKGTIENTIDNVPVKANYRTNIIGNLLTSKTDFEIVVDEKFNANDYVVEGETSFVSVSSAEEFVKFAEELASGNEEYKDVNLMLGGDIDLADFTLTRSVASNWIPIGTPENPFTGTFDGNGYTIKNLKLVETEAKEGKAFIGFFGYAKDATIKNVTFENVYMNIPCLDIDHSQGHIGAVAGSLEGTSTIENVTVEGDIKVEATVTANGASRVAVVAGGNSYGNVTMKNVHVIANEGSYLKANNNVGALAGQLQGKNVFENCSSNIDVTGTKFFAGGLIGLAAGDSQFTNCHTTGDVTITAGRVGRNHDQYRVGGIAGGWADGATKVCTLTDCSYTGTISGKNSDGSVASPLDYLGYVGRGYTLNGCQGSKVIIDGVEFVQKYNTAAEAGVYEVNGVESAVVVNTVDELNAALNNAEVPNIVLGKGDFGTIVAKSNKTIVGSENAKVGCVHLNASENVTLKDINFYAEGAQQIYHKKGTPYGYANILTGTQDNNPNQGAWNVTIDGCKFYGDFDNNGYAIGFVDQNRGGGQTRNVTVNNCVFESTNSICHIYGYYFGGGYMTVENNIFKAEAQKAIYLGRYQSSTPVVVKDNVFKAWNSLDEAMTLQDHGSYGVSIEASGNTFAE